MHVFVFYRVCAFIWYVTSHMIIKNQNHDFRVYRKIFPYSFPRSCGMKTKKERSMHMRNFKSNIQSVKTKLSHIRVSRNLSPSDFDRMDISWSSCSLKRKRRKYAYGYFDSQDYLIVENELNAFSFEKLIPERFWTHILN